MKLYRAKIPLIAKEVIGTLLAADDIEVAPENRQEAEKDLIAIMEEYLRRDMEVRGRIKDFMARRNIPYDEYGRTRKQVAEELNHPMGDDVERFLARQFIENLLISPYIEEVFGEDSALYKKVLEIILKHDVDEREIREEAIARIKNIPEGTVDYEIALQNAMREVRKRRGLL